MPNLLAIPKSLSQTKSAQFRRQRFESFLRLLRESQPGNEPIHILDVGGLPSYWEEMGYWDEPDLASRTRITVINLVTRPTNRPEVESLIGDARDLREFEDGSFSLAFSNSVIEHVGRFEDQQRMANEVRRVARSYYVQVPNYWFPIEPHFVFPGVQFMPDRAALWLHSNFSLGHMPRQADAGLAARDLYYLRLLNERELRKLFPDCTILREKYAGLVKSLVAYRM